MGLERAKRAKGKEKSSLCNGRQKNPESAPRGLSLCSTSLPFLIVDADWFLEAAEVVERGERRCLGVLVGSLDSYMQSMKLWGSESCDDKERTYIFSLLGSSDFIPRPLTSSILENKTTTAPPLVLPPSRPLPPPPHTRAQALPLRG